MKMVDEIHRLIIHQLEHRFLGRPMKEQAINFIARCNRNLLVFTDETGRDTLHTGAVLLDINPYLSQWMECNGHIAHRVRETDAHTPIFQVRLARRQVSYFLLIAQHFLQQDTDGQPFLPALFGREAGISFFINGKVSKHRAQLLDRFIHFPYGYRKVSLLIFSIYCHFIYIVIQRNEVTKNLGSIHFMFPRFFASL